MAEIAETYETIRYRVVDPVATITLSRPDRLNAMNGTMLAELRSSVDRAAADPDVVGIVITGDGRAFSAGLDTVDLTAVAGSAELGDPPPAAERKGLFSYLTQVPKPVIAAVNGVAAGGGYVLATMCDIRFACPASRFTTVFSKRGLVAEHGTSWTTPRLVGTGRALDLLWTSRMVEAAEAYRIGLVEYLVDCDPPEAVATAAEGYIRGIAAVASPAALADNKRMVWDHHGASLDSSLDDTWEIMAESLKRPDLAEGVASFVERRRPEFPRLST